MHAQSVTYNNLKREEHFKSGKWLMYEKTEEKKSIINILLTPNHAA